ncbi:MAG: division/cell wall cluster transcriptional repressor MraZ [Pseudomonadota bacterium]
MGRRFRGESTQKVDNKGRVSIPASFRRVLAAGDPDWSEGLPANLVIVYGDQRRNYLECYTIEAIEAVDDRISRLPLGSTKRAYLEKMFTGLSLETSVDNTGRLVLPKKLRDKIGLSNDSEAFFIASGDRFQIWRPDTYEAEQNAGEDALFEDLPEGADPLMLFEME